LAGADRAYVVQVAKAIRLQCAFSFFSFFTGSETRSQVSLRAHTGAIEVVPITR